MTRLKLIGAGAALVLTLSATVGFAQQPVAAHSPSALAKAELAAKAAMHRKPVGAPAQSTPAPRPSAPVATAPGEHSAISIACSKKADAQGLHGDARRAFRNKCKHGGS